MNATAGTRRSRDSILPAIEEGLIRFIGSTTENPMISMTPAIVSRCRVFALPAADGSERAAILLSAIADRERGLGDMNVHIDVDALSHIVRVANGDVRSALNALELAALTTPAGRDGIHITLSVAEESIQKPVVTLRRYAVLRYAVRLLQKPARLGQRRGAFLVQRGCCMPEPIRACWRGVSLPMPARMWAWPIPSPCCRLWQPAQALELIGMPEARLPLSQAIIAICESPKSNSVVCAIDAAMADAESARGQVPPPLRDTHYKGADRLGAGGGYLYPHDYPGHWVKQQYMPDEIKDHEYYHPSDQGHEAKIHKHEK